MITHTVQQGSQDWHALRASCFTASEAPAMAGVSKYTSRSDLLKQKYTGEVPEVKPAQQRIFDRGHAAEAKARPIAERIIGEELYPCTATHDDHEWMLASFDGCTMLEDVVWEHKLINDELRTATAETLAEHYKVQMDQQLAVSGAEKCLFMASDGTEDDCNYFWYTTTPERIAAVFAGWAQFKADLEAYRPQAQTVAPQGEAPDKLPALSIQMTGGVQASNLPDFKAKAMAMIDGIKTQLVTDKDFADAESTVKFLQKGEKQLEESKQRALEQTASIAELFDTIDELRETMRQKRLHLDKLVKAEKNNRRVEIERKAKEAFDAFLANLDCPLKPAHSLDIAGAMKGKKTIATLQAAADDEVARAKIECQQLANEINGNKVLLDKEQGDYGFLFSDWRDLIQKKRDDLQSVIAARIAQHKEAEQKKLDAERETIRQEEAVKAKREADEAEAKRQAEEAEKRKPEPQPAPEPEPAAAEHKPIDTSRLEAAADNFQRGSQVKTPEQVTISRKEYDQLLAAQARLYALEDAGVSHWSGYRDAIKQLNAA
ncbi:YqaJ viral recombinase family protein [Halomonas venusta]|uniref:lambda-exonuclease family protein n=1 Tax=Vreelandella venusta TaxID=44935 RepID=UPI00295EE092|nr:YqaJ viral recombinase family protein [Halomonas venusta]MDW0360868.1 YqaJ viral recombinase family protein [Halomonas venusta]